MIPHFSFCSNYAQPLEYCLLDKKMRKDQRPGEEDLKRQVKNRAEVLYYHQCYGNDQDLIRQFKEVQKLNYCVCKPAFHLSLNLPPGDKITNSQFVDIAKDCAKTLGFEQHQYVVIRHKDAKHPHIHLVVNRVGLDEHTMDDSHILRRTGLFCQAMEQKHQLTRTKSIRRYRTPEERLEPSQHKRVVDLKENIRQTLRQVDNLDDFIGRMGERGYTVYRLKRGIAFKDSDGVFKQGHKVDYPWKKVEAALAQNLALHQAQQLRIAEEERRLTQRRGLRMHL